MLDTTIQSPQSLYEEFLKASQRHSLGRSPLDVLTGEGGAKARALMEAMDVSLKLVIANELHRIANALEAQNASN